MLISCDLFMIDCKFMIVNSGQDQSTLTEDWKDDKQRLDEWIFITSASVLQSVGVNANSTSVIQSQRVM